MNINSPVLSERFWSKVDVSFRMKCWAWRGGKDEHGYGNVMIAGKVIKAPRVAFFLRNGTWPRNACHSCDNPSCCNPDHIFDGTRSDNMKDMVSKGRHRIAIGEKHGGAVLTDKKVIAMRKEYVLEPISMESLAKKYGCSFGTVQRVIRRKNWRHLL